MTLTSFILRINVSIFSSRNGFLEIFNIENVQKYMLKLLKWIKAGIMIPKKNCQGLPQGIRIVLGHY